MEFVETTFGDVLSGGLFWSRTGLCYTKVEQLLRPGRCGDCGLERPYNALHTNDAGHFVHFCPHEKVQVRIGDR
jgi:hypothetical protein